MVWDGPGFPRFPGRRCSPAGPDGGETPPAEEAFNTVMTREQGIAFLALLVVLLAAPALADEQVEAIFEKVHQLNPGLEDYSADIEIQLEARVAIFPYRPRLKGRYYHKRPDLHKLELTEGPNYLKKYPNAFGFSLPRLERFHSRVEGETTLADGTPVWHIVLLPAEGMGDIRRVELWVNRRDYTIARHETRYERNGLLRVEASYRRERGFVVFDRVQATFQFPAVAVTARATATYANYTFNPGLPAEFFAKESQ